MQNKLKILLAEDEPSLAQIIAESLESRSFEVVYFADGHAALDGFISQKFDVLVLDIMMPKMDGLSLAIAIRKINADIPILFLTAKSQTDDVIAGFGAGGNDYLKKPFSLEELIVRIQSLLRHKFQKSETIKIGNYDFDVLKQTLTTYNLQEILTFRETELLEFLITNKNQVIDRDIILKKIWGSDDFFSGRSLDVFITKLRKKLSDDDKIQIINLRGVGYKLIC